MAPGNLPHEVTSFIGRQQEVGEVKRALTRARLLTLTGTGGSGKTRLSLRVASSLVDEYPDGVWFVGLETLSDPALVPQTIASTMGLREDPGRDILTTLTEHLRPLHALLVLDNCEHLMEACTRLADILFNSCPQLSMLTTSRQVLGIAGETVYWVPSLSAPDIFDEVTADSITQYEAVQLFRERAIYSRQSFAITPRNAEAVAQLCRRLDGLPLAIELAAARIKVLSVEQIVDRLDSRFRLLTSGSPTALPRQQTLRALLDWSYDLLDESERRVLRELSVFAGSFTLEAARSICMPGLDEYEAIDMISNLVDKSLVIADERESVVRYRLLETIRQYAADRLQEAGDADSVRDRHQGWYAEFVDNAAPQLLGEDQAEWVREIGWEHDNLRAALEWGIKGGGSAELALRMGAYIWHFWNLRGHISEGRRWIEEALEVAENAPAALRARAYNSAANLAHLQGDYERAAALYERSLALRREIGDTHGVASSLTNLGVLAVSQGNYEQATRLHRESLQILRELGDDASASSVLNNLGFALRCLGQYEQATELFRESLASSEARNDLFDISLGYNNLGEVAHASKDYPRAAEFYEHALEISTRLGDDLGVVGVMCNLARLAHDRNKYEQSEELYRQALLMARRIEHRLSMVECLEGLAMLEAHRWPERAAMLYGAADALREKLGARMHPINLENYERHFTLVSGAMSDDALQAVLERGRALRLNDALEMALQSTADWEFELHAGGAGYDTRPLEGGLGAGGVLPMPAPPYPHGLTRREVEVLRLAALGHSDLQIAEMLTISKRTVGAHLSNLYAKIGVDNRSAAARWAVENRII